jgi:hypothetical protein
MKFFDLQYYKNHSKTHSANKKDGVVDYSTYLSIGPLIADLISKKSGAVNYWTGIIGSDYEKKLLEKLYSPEYEIPIKELSVNGNYIHKLANDFLKKKVHPKLCSSQTLYSEVLFAWSKYHNREPNVKIGYEGIIADFTGVFLWHFLGSNEKKLIGEIVSDFIHSEKECEVCKSKFYVIDFPEWLYKRVNGNINVCYECPTFHNSKKEMLGVINTLVSEIGFIPNSGFQMFQDDSYSVRVEKRLWSSSFLNVLKLGGSINGGDHIKKKFGGWFQALVEAGVIEGGRLKTARGYKCIAKSGNVCNSLDEQFIDNYLFSLGHKPLKEPKYPFHSVFNPRTLLRADWLLEGKFIEYFGLKGEINYDIKTSNKIKLCADIGLDLIPIYPDDLSNLDKIFSVFQTRN